MSTPTTDNGALPTDLDTLLEAVEQMMGEEFTDALSRAIDWSADQARRDGFRESWLLARSLRVDAQ